MSAEPPTPHAAARPEGRRELARLGVALVVLLFASLHLAAIFTEAINWDEIGLLARTATLARTGTLQASGRPGAAEIVLVPFVRGCRDVIQTAREARLLWYGVTALGVVGLYFFLRDLRSARRDPELGAVVGVAVLTLAPTWLRWSLQVRTDQVAIALGLWAGVALLRSRSRPWLAPAAGLLFGLGYLFTQKLLYVAALVLLACFWKLAIAADGRRARAVGRFLLLAASAGMVFALVLASYRLGGAAVVKLPPPLSLGVQFSIFGYYRRTYGFSIYRAMLPSLLPQLLLLALLAAATFRAARRRAVGSALLAAWSILALGFAIGLFHAAAFPYFWMTLGLFAAVALGITFEEWIGLVPERRRTLAMLVLSFGLVVPGLVSAFALLRDSQGVQSDSLAFIDRNFAPTAAGFQAEGALLCRQERGPFPSMFRQDVLRRFSGPDPAAAIAETIDTFSRTPVQFLIVSGAVVAFPRPVLEFLHANYQPYFGPVLVAGRNLRGEAGASQAIEIVVPGVYRFLPREADAAARVRVDGHELLGGQAIELAAGEARVDYLTDLRQGLLVLALQDPPQRTKLTFFDGAAAQEMRAGR